MSSLHLPLALWHAAPVHSVTAIVYAPRTRTVVTGSKSGQLALWSVNHDETGKVSLEWRSLLVRHSARIVGVDTCLYDGVVEAVISACSNGILAVWYPAVGRCLLSRKTPILSTVFSAKVLPGGERIACVGGDTCIIVEVYTLQPVHVLSAHSNWVLGVSVVSWLAPKGPTEGTSEDGWSLATVGNDNVIHLWSLEACQDGEAEPVPAANPVPFHTESQVVSITASHDGARMLVVTAAYCELVCGSGEALLSTWREEPASPARWAGGFSHADRPWIVLWTSMKDVLVYDVCPKPDDPRNVAPKLIARYGVDSKLHGQLTVTLGPASTLMGGDTKGNVIVWDLPKEHAQDDHEEPGHDAAQQDQKMAALVSNIPRPWKSDDPARVTATTMLEKDGLPIAVVRGMSTGRISVRVLVGASGRPGGDGEEGPRAFVGHQHAVSALLVPETERPILVSGGDDHTVRFWDWRAEECLSTMRHHTSSVIALVQPPPRMGGVLRDCVASVASDRGVVITSLTTFEVTHVFGGHPYPVSSLGWLAEGGYVVVFCTDASAHVWNLDSGMLERHETGPAAADIKTRCEFASKQGLQKAKHLNTQAAGKQSRMVEYKTINMSSTPGSCPIQLLDIQVRKCTVALYQELLDNRVQKKVDSDGPVGYGDAYDGPAAGFGVNEDFVDPRDVAIFQHSIPLQFLRLVLSVLVPWGIDGLEDMEEQYQRVLQLQPLEGLAFAVRGHGGAFTLLSTSYNKGCKRWQCSSLLTALHSLCGAAVSKTLLSLKGTTPAVKRVCSDLIATYCTKLAEAVPSYCLPSFAFLTLYYQDPQDDLQQAARSLFGAAITGMAEEERQAVVSDWYRFLPQDNKDISEKGATAVLILAIFGCDRGSSLPGEVRQALIGPLWDLILKGTGTYQAVATELLGRGFLLWQSYIDDNWRVCSTLFELTLLTNNVVLANAAKKALLFVAVHEPSISVQVLGTVVVSKKRQTQSNVIRKQAALKALTNLISKHPARMVTELSRLVEVVVRALDPNVAHQQRDRLLPTIASTLHELVNRYPMVDFHQDSQRLAAGVPDKDVIIVFDLKTATKLLALEGHKGGISAVSFRSDGKHVASYSFEDETMRIWSLSSGFFGVFGAGGKEQKTIKIEGTSGVGLSDAAKLDQTRITWVSDKQITLVRGRDVRTIPV